jgi:heptosyltransferase-3
MMSGAVLGLVNARIGDTLLVTPALRAIKAAWPDRDVVVRAHRLRAPLLDALPFVDRIETIPRRAFRAVAILARRRFDVAFCWSDDPDLLRYCRRAAAKVVAFGANRRDDGFVAVPRPARPMHAVDERLLLPAALGIAPAGRRLAYVVQPRERAWAARWTAAHGLLGRDVVALALSSFPGKSYRDWPIARFAALADALAARDTDLRFLVLGDARSRTGAAALAHAIPGRIVDATGRTTLRETAALLDQSRLYVGVDTGPTHVAGALGVPMVAVYHCFHRGRLLAPLEHAALEVIEHPCPDELCSRETPMSEVGVEPVIAACRKLLALPDPRARSLAA